MTTTTMTAPYVFDERYRPTIVIRDSAEDSAIRMALGDRIRTAQAFAENVRFSEMSRESYRREAAILQRMYDSL